MISPTETVCVRNGTNFGPFPTTGEIRLRGLIMEQLVVLMYSHDDIQKIQNIVKSNNSITALLTGDYYSIVNYLSHNNKREFSAILDRNFYTRITSIVNSALPNNRNHADYQWAAAVLAFCQIAEITFDYASSLQEYASTQGGKSALTELNAFRLADNTDPKLFIDFATGRVDKLDTAALPKISPLTNVPSAKSFEATPTDFSFNYIFMLKIALISRESIEPHERMLKFLDWMHSDYLFGAPALQFANIFFSPNRHSKMLKNYTEAGIKNAAWDLSLIQNWRKSALIGAKNDRPVLLISRDKAVRSIASRLVAETEEELLSHIACVWGRKNNCGRKIYERYCQLWDNAESNQTRRVAPSIAYITEMRTNMEKQLYLPQNY